MRDSGAQEAQRCGARRRSDPSGHPGQRGQSGRRFQWFDGAEWRCTATGYRCSAGPCRFAGRDVDYLEAHGTGTSLGDPIEVQAAAAVYGVDRDPNRPLLIGSVKTNIGHLESAAGVAGVIKVVLSLQHEVLPQHLHFKNPSPHIPWESLPVRVVDKAIPWHGQRQAATRRG